MGRSPKVAVVGAGSLSHGKRLVDDLLSLEEISEGCLALMGNNLPRLEVVGNYAKRTAAIARPGLEILVTGEPGSALEGTDIVLALFDAGGFPAFDRDFRIAERYGLDVCIGDTVGPLAALRAMRNGPVMLALADRMKAFCPGALLVNYVNPMAPMVAAAASRGIPCVGVCGGIEATRSYTAALLGLGRDRLRTAFAGVNHLCWLLEMKGPEGDLYPRFRELMRNPELRGEESTRFEMLQQFGYFATESSGHISDFFPYFRRTPELRARYCSGPGYSGAPGAYHRLSSFVQRRIGGVDYLEGAERSKTRSLDYGPAIVEAWIGRDKRRSVYGNVMNGSPRRKPALSLLPAGACVELPVEIEGRSLRVPPAPVLPSTLAALCMPSATQHGLMLEALLAGDPELLFAAIALDQSTAAVLDLPAIRSLTAELLAANKEWIPAGLAKPLRATVDAGLRPRSRRSWGSGDSSVELVKDYERRRKRKADSGPSPGP